jgi:hypothetical protein
MPTRTWIVCGAFVAVLAALAGVALAAIPDSEGRIHACRKVSTGILRAIQPDARCRDGERRLRWNVRGRRGPEGPPGPAGPPGPPGEPGPGLASFDELNGLECTLGANTGSIEIGYDLGSGEARVRCVVPTPATAQIRVNEYSTGVEGALTDEFIEIFNPGPESADLSGYKLVYRSATGTSDVSLLTVAAGTVLAPGAFLVFGGAGYSGSAQHSFTGSLASSGGGVGIRDASGFLLDSVGWGAATNALVEGTAAVAPAVAPAPGKSGARHPDGADTDDNATDFTEGDPTPGAPN